MLVKNFKRQEIFFNAAKNLLDANVTLNQLTMLFEIANNNGSCMMAEVAAKHDWSKTTAARAFKRLSRWETPTKEGLGLVEFVPIDYNTREKPLQLTEFGIEVVKKLDEAFL